MMPRHALLQDIFNMLPNMNVEALSTSLAVKGKALGAPRYDRPLCTVQSRGLSGNSGRPGLTESA